MHAEQTAQAIVDLINRRPQSPRVEEIAAIIGRASLGDVLDGYEDLARWLEVVDAWLDVDPAYLEDDHPRHADSG